MDGNKIIGINGGTYNGDGPGADPDVVAFLEDLLEHAKSGEILEVSTVYQYGDWIYTHSVGCCEAPYTILGAIWDLGASYREDYCGSHSDDD